MRHLRHQSMSTQDILGDVRFKREDMRRQWDAMGLTDANRVFAMISASCHSWRDPRQTDTPREILIAIAALAVAAIEAADAAEAAKEGNTP